ncbi:hypothetical protein [Paenibacillus sp. MMS18-CY102]|uniref:hypothetical protein n=1 Tax=Paenibacillus sp. MMS18-CY102 TaxID=2682849 RepID=UPI0013667E8E|nr:hypothetical protein [Paenibacillus sp. MMS18-CY102]MWC31282.1 hypothetical protein [Paenibacillus sp. MMS18-CY102]
MRNKRAKFMAVSALALALTVSAGAWLSDGVVNAAASATGSSSVKASASDSTKDTATGNKGGRKGGDHKGFHAPFANETVAKALGLTADELKTELQGGKSLADIAKAKSVDVTVVTKAVEAVLKEKLDARLADGKLTQAKYDEQSAKLAEHATAIVNGEKGAGFAGERGGKGGHGGFHAPFANETVAKALGLTADELKTELQGGKSLADIAKAKSVDAAVVTKAVEAVLKEKLDARLANGKLTQAQYDEQAAKLAEHAAAIVNGEKGAGFGGGVHGGKGGPGHGKGKADSTAASVS